MTESHGFEILRERKLPEVNATARHYRHLKTGAELLSLLNNDENKVFGVTFATPPADSTGIPHILEHSVLCGSRKFPVKEPFVELMKGSLYTFLNAMTFSDMTCYPIASQNLKDFYNLIDVYLDAVFYPLITPNTFRQEGWHYELDAVDKPLVFKGVVFNEMKGSYSSPDNRLNKLSQLSLFPDTVYGVDSGGDPRNIPDLTYADLKAFHQRHYHPSNAKLFFYGDDDPEQRLRLINDRLTEFSRKEVDFTVPLQPRFSAPKRLTHTYAASAQEVATGAATRQSMIQISWMLDEIVDAETALGLDILEYILLGTPAAPLYKALLDSGLCEGLTAAGLNDLLRQPMFTVGLKGIDPADADRIETLINDTLGKLATAGIDPADVDAALNTIEFRLRENNTGRDPRGIVFMVKALRTWMRRRDPLVPLAFEAPLHALKARITTGRYFEDLLERHLIRNQHRTILLLLPDRDQGERDAREEAERLAKVRASMSPADLSAVIEQTRLLKRMQETPDSPEALASIPSLKLSDMPPRNKFVPIEAMKIGETSVLYHDLFTNGVVYLDLAFDLHRLPGELLPHVELFGRALLETGAGDDDFVKLSQRMGRSTGGIRPTHFTSTTVDRKGATGWLVLRSKALPGKVQPLTAILRDVLTGARLDNRERFQQLVLEEKAAIESSLVPAGRSYVDTRLRACFSEDGWADELIGGVSYLFHLRKLADQVANDWDGVAATLERIRKILVDRSTMLANVTAEPAHWATLRPQLADLLAALPLGAAPSSRWQVADWPWGEGLVVPSNVNYVGKGVDLYALGLKSSGANLVIQRYLNTAWLWTKVRVQGGAYGGSCRLDRYNGVFTFLSYRDPNLTATLDVYDGTAEFLKTLALDDAELTRAIIGTIGDLDSYELPDAKGYTSMQHYLVGCTEEERQRFRDEVLGTNKADFAHFADVLAMAAVQGRVTVLGSEQAIEAANTQRPGLLTVTSVI
jgi:Zn-dependent M16 (insulinase) family peptidase